MDSLYLIEVLRWIRNRESPDNPLSDDDLMTDFGFPKAQARAILSELRDRGDVGFRVGSHLTYVHLTQAGLDHLLQALGALDLGNLRHAAKPRPHATPRRGH